MPICALGDPEDLSLTYVSWLARRRGLTVFELSEALLGSDWVYEFDDEVPGEGTLRARSEVLSFSEVSGIYVRLSPHPGLPPGLSLTTDERDALVIERRGAIEYLLNRFPAIVANRPAAGRSNGAKPYQMRMLAELGLDVPAWIATNDGGAAAEFARSCGGRIVYKSCSGLRSHVRMLDRELRSRLSHGTSPVILQEYVDGRDVRVHVVGQGVFGTAVISAGVDYRFESEGNQFVPADIPEGVAELCRVVAAAEGLVIAGIDFRVTDDGRWLCLECNPVPTFIPYEMATGQPIGEALVDILAGVSDCPQ